MHRVSVVLMLLVHEPLSSFSKDSALNCSLWLPRSLRLVYALHLAIDHTPPWSGSTYTEPRSGSSLMILLLGWFVHSASGTYVSESCTCMHWASGTSSRRPRVRTARLVSALATAWAGTHQQAPTRANVHDSRLRGALPAAAVRIQHGCLWQRHGCPDAFDCSLL
jgi:hypothetical protein